MPLDPIHSEHIARELKQVRGLLLALGELDGRSDSQPIPHAAHDAVKRAMGRALDDVGALVEGYTASLGVEGGMTPLACAIAALCLCVNLYLVYRIGPDFARRVWQLLHRR